MSYVGDYFDDGFKRENEEGRIGEAIFAHGLAPGGQTRGVITIGQKADNTNLVHTQRRFGSNPTPSYASGSSTVDPALAMTAGRAAEQPASGGGSASNAYAGRAAEQLAGSGTAYTGHVAAEQPMFGGLQAGRSSNLDAEEAQRQRTEEQFWAERRQQQRVAALRQRYEALLQAPTHATPRVLDGAAAGALESRAGLQGGVEVHAVGVSPIAPPPSQQVVPGHHASSSKVATVNPVPAIDLMPVGRLACQ